MAAASKADVIKASVVEAVAFVDTPAIGAAEALRVAKADTDVVAG